MQLKRNLSALPGTLLLSLASPTFAVVPGGSDAPIRYTGDAYVDQNLLDGGLRPVVGVHNIQVLRANRSNPTDGGTSDGYTYQHAPTMAYWNNQYYVHWLAGIKDENGLSMKTYFSHSADGRVWSAPAEVFPIWSIPGFNPGTNGSYHHRMSFFTAPNGKLLVMSVQGANNGYDGTARVVREIKSDNTLGPIYTIRKIPQFAGTPVNPMYTTSGDAAFKAACDAMLSDVLAREQWWEEDRGTDIFKVNYAGTSDGELKAMSSYTRLDGKTVGLWKYTFGAISADNGNTWSLPLKQNSIITAGAKIWGQKTDDGHFALIYNPTSSNLRRWPLAMVTSDDGITFDNMGSVFGEVPPQRYVGTFLNLGPQYVRGISEWNGNPPGNELWFTNSLGKNDIFVSRVPIPARLSVTSPVNDNFNTMAPGGYVTDWNIYSGIWCPANIVDFPGSGNRSLELQDRDPTDYAKAVRVFPESTAPDLTFKVYAAQNNTGQLDVEVAAERGQRPVRLSFASDGYIKGTNGAAVTNLQTYSSNTWYDINIKVNAVTGKFDVSVGGVLRMNQANVAEPVKSVERLVFRTGPFRTAPDATSTGYASADFPNGGTAVTLAKFNIDDVVTAADNAPPTIAAVYPDGKSKLEVRFSEPLDQVTAETAANYSLSPAIAVAGAVRGKDPRTVVLTVAADLAAGTNYTLTVNNVKDQFNNPIAAASTGVFTIGTAPVSGNAMKLWVKADVGITKDANNLVGTWADQSGSGINLTCSVTANKPLFVSSVLNGKPAVRFDGINDYLERAATGLMAEKFTVFMVMKASYPAQDQNIFDTATDGSLSRHQFSQGPKYLGMYSNMTDQHTAGDYIVYAGVFDGGRSRSYVNFDKSFMGMISETKDGSYTEIPADSASPFVMGARYTKNQYFYNGDMLEFIIYKSALTEADRKATEAYLMNKYFAQPGQTSQVASPTFSPPAGNYATAQSVMIGTTTGGAAIRFTTNGSDPTSTTGTLYSAPVSISSNTTLKAIAYTLGMTDSSVTTGAYTIGPGPVEMIVDNLDATQIPAASWTASTTLPGYFATNYYHDGNTGKGKTISFTPNLPSGGSYEIYARWNADSARSNNVPFTINHRNGATTIFVNQQVASGTWTQLTSGTATTFELNAGTAANVVIGTAGTSGYVIADAIRFVKVGELSQMTTLLDDPFSDGTRANGADPYDSQWYLLSNAPPTSGDVTSGALVIGTTSNNVAGTNPHAVTTFPATTLAAGEKISLSFDFGSSGVASATGIRFGLYNSGGTNLTGDLYANPPPTGTIFQNDLGYSVFAPHQGNQAITLYSRAANGTNNTLQVASAANTSAIGSTVLASATNATGMYTASLSLARTAGGYDYTVTYAGTTFTGSTPVVTTSTFDTLSIFGIEGPNAYLTIDNVSVLAGPTTAGLNPMTWRLAIGIPADGSQDLSNPSGDGIPNLLKCALNLARNAGDLEFSRNHPLSNPMGITVDELTGLPVIQIDVNSAAVFTYIRHRNAGAYGLHYTVEWSERFETWMENAQATEETLPLDPDWERVTVTASNPPPGTGARFARLKVNSM